MTNALLKAAGIRALRTLIQGIIAGGLVNVAVAVALEGADPRALILAATTAVTAAIIAFLQGILSGLPEAEPVMLGVEPSNPNGLAHVIATVGGNIVSEGHFDVATGNAATKAKCDDCPGNCAYECVENATD